MDIGKGMACIQNKCRASITWNLLRNGSAFAHESIWTNYYALMYFKILSTQNHRMTQYLMNLATVKEKTISN